MCPTRAAVAHSKRPKAALPPRGKASCLSVKTDARLRELFHGACRVLGTTVESRVNDFMRSTIAEAGIDLPSSA